MGARSVNEVCACRGCGKDVETDEAVVFVSCVGGGNLAENGVRG